VRTEASCIDLSFDPYLVGSSFGSFDCYFSMSENFVEFHFLRIDFCLELAIQSNGFHGCLPVKLIY
jgi:hypothetical protein